MRCAELANLLSKLEPPSGEAPVAELGAAERALLSDVIARGWAARIEEPPADRAGLAPGRAALAELRARRAGGESGPALDAEERRLREELLALSERLARWEGSVGVSAAEGGPYRDAATPDASLGRLALTVRGRALLGDLAPRLARAGALEVDALQQELQLLRSTLSARAKRAAEILRLASPALREVDEIHLRSAAIGLSVRREAPEHVASAFVRAIQGGLLGSQLPDDKESVAAECLVVRAGALGEVDPSGPTSWLLQAWSHLSASGAAASPTDAANAALLISTVPPDRQARVVDDAQALLASLPPPFGAGRRDLAPALHLVVTGHAAQPAMPQRLAETEAALLAQTGNDPHSFAAAALLVSAQVDLAAALGRFGRLRGVLARFGASGMVVPAALLSLLAMDVEEVLDDLRLAGAAIGEHKLALGGMENTSLAIKLLLAVALLATGDEGDPEENLDLAPRAVPTLPSMGSLGVSVALPMAVATVSAFHQTTIHRMAVSDFLTHPAHSHYVYG